MSRRLLTSARGWGRSFLWDMAVMHHTGKMSELTSDRLLKSARGRGRSFFVGHGGHASYRQDVGAHVTQASYIGPRAGTFVFCGTWRSCIIPARCRSSRQTGFLHRPEGGDVRFLWDMAVMHHTGKMSELMSPC